jgi:hypothetical protein
MAAPELSPAGRREPGPRDTRARAPALCFVLTSSLYWGYLILRLPIVATVPTPGEAVNLRVGPTSFPRAIFLGLVR